MYLNWSCLIGRVVYSATDECAQPSDLLKFDRESFFAILKKYPANESLLYKHLAETLGNRLLLLYPNIS